MESTDVFHSPSKGDMNLTRVITEIAEFIEEESESFYRLVIGTDSQTRRVGEGAQINFVTAIVIHRIGHGGRYFYRINKQSKSFQLRDKIYTETLFSLDLAEKFVPEVRKIISPKRYDLEIHIDVGSLGPTREMIREVVGMVQGNGYTAKTKPEAYGAFVVADRYT